MKSGKVLMNHKRDENNNPFLLVINCKSIKHINFTFIYPDKLQSYFNTNNLNKFIYIITI